MFTGLIESVGSIQRVESRGGEIRFVIESRPAFEGIVLGESIAVNGVCLTVEQFSGGSFSVYASGETLKTTTLGSFRPGRPVNLERALALGDRLGGHLVSGHVDCLAEVVSISPAGESQIFRFSFAAEHGPFVVPKGSICLDGVSLTVNKCGPDFLTVNLIPETQKQTALSEWSPGAKVNMETDLIGKYVQRMVAPWSADDEKKSGLSEDFLRKHNFF